MTQPIVGMAIHEARACPELLTTYSDPNLEIIRVTAGPALSADTRGMECMFTPDSRRFIFRRTRSGGFLAPQDYYLCDLDDQFTIYPLVERAVRGCALSADGCYLYYLTGHPKSDTPSLTLNRVSLETFAAETLIVFDVPADGKFAIPRFSAGMMTMRADGRMLCVAMAFRNDDGTTLAPMFINLETLTTHTFPWPLPMHPWQSPIGAYYQGRDAAYSQTLALLNTHQREWFDAEHTHHIEWTSDSHAATVQVVTEQGGVVAEAPAAGERESVTQLSWLGDGTALVARVAPDCVDRDSDAMIVRIDPVTGARCVLTRDIKQPDILTMSWDRAGKHVICEAAGLRDGGTQAASSLTGYLWLGSIVERNGEDPHLQPQYLLHPYSRHIRVGTRSNPVLSPDGRTVFFTSDFGNTAGYPQLFAARGYALP